MIRNGQSLDYYTGAEEALKHVLAALDQEEPDSSVAYSFRTLIENLLSTVSICTGETLEAMSREADEWDAERAEYLKQEAILPLDAIESARLLQQAREQGIQWEKEQAA